MTLTCVTPAGGMAIGGPGAHGSGTKDPAPSAAPVPIIRTDEDGNQTVVDNALVYNTCGSYVIPGNAPCKLARTNAGHYYVTECPGANPSVPFAWNGVGPNGVPDPRVGGLQPGDTGSLDGLPF
jgi:hypothetical protein